jgi:energy-coupling factor transporter transmembrane protein EcfT
MHLFFLIAILSFIFFFSPGSIIIPGMLILVFILFWIAFLKLDDLSERIVLSSIVAIVGFGLLTGTYFYPNVLKFQSASQIGKEIKDMNVPEDEFYLYGTHSHSLDFYSNRMTQWVDYNTMAGYKKGTLIFTDEKGMEELCGDDGPGYKVVKSYDDYYVTALSFEFLLKKSREGVLTKKYLLEKI